MVAEKRNSNSLIEQIARNKGFRLEPLDTLLRAEGDKSSKSLDILVINLDAEETRQVERNNRDKQATVDFCFFPEGTKNLRLVECRYKYKQPCNMSAKKIKDKIHHSRDLLCGELVSEGCTFLFSRNVMNQARSAVARVFGCNNEKDTKKKGIEVMTTADFIKEYFG